MTCHLLSFSAFFYLLRCFDFFRIENRHVQLFNLSVEGLKLHRYTERNTIKYRQTDRQTDRQTHRQPASQGRAGEDRAGLDRIVPYRTEQDRTGQDKIAQDRTRQDRTGQDRAGQDGQIDRRRVKGGGKMEKDN